MKQANDELCCLWFFKAQQDGSDNEGYGPLIYKIDDEYHIGCYLTSMKFCPWCGHKIKMELSLPSGRMNRKWGLIKYKFCKRN